MTEENDSCNGKGKGGRRPEEDEDYLLKGEGRG
jgi:hypothetical protein